MTNAEAYAVMQKASGINVGDRVRILRKAESNENGWGNAWVDPMSMCVDGTFIVQDVNPTFGIRLKDANSGFPTGGHFYPFFVLELVERKEELPEPTWRPEPFEKVLARDEDTDSWKPTLFSFYEEGELFPFVCIGNSWKQCIPFLNNEELAGRK